MKKQKSCRGFVPVVLAFCVLSIFKTLVGQPKVTKHGRSSGVAQSQKRPSNRSKVLSHRNLKGEIGKFAPTFYRILDQDSPEWPVEPETVKLKSCDGEHIASVSRTFKHHLDIEGSARLHGGRIINIGDKRHGESCWLEPEKAPYGLGEDGNGLIPYRSLAVDPNIVKLGTVLYIPALEGLRLPTGEIHDGLVIAHDTGTAIDGYRIDVFVGFENDEDNTLTRSGQIEDMKPTAIYEVDDETADEVREKLEYGDSNGQ